MALCIFLIGENMKKVFLLALPLLVFTLALTACHKQTQTDTPYNRTSEQDGYERQFKHHIFAACQNPGTPYATYSLAHVNAKPTDKDPRYKVTFVNGPCEGKTVFTQDYIEKTSPVGNGRIVRGDVVLRDYWNPRKLSPEIEHLDHWNIGVVYDTSRLEEQGVVELEFPRDRNDFMAAREFIFVRNLRYIEKPKRKDPRTWL